MTYYKTTTNFYFHPIVIPSYLLFPFVMSIPIISLLTVVTSFEGYAFILFMTILTVILAIRIIKYFIRLVTGRPALSLTEKSLIDYQTGLKIDWTDIKDLNLGGTRTTYISIKLLDQEKYISLFKNPLTKIFYRLKSKIFHGTFTVNVSLIKGNNDKIFESAKHYLTTIYNEKKYEEKAST
ncbi:STM3941 family protein [Pedobacter cryophilus]|uniref:Uncharacterized protein n=1 Tax=Pedobacter cryophilus TaxID=2571271 RepID=A0A4U1C115_9SPHI|nr:STM3941 family protein [Pedobacter cryophilus]TKB97573.1 hypothetical protein FA046_09380 [Pedobacter cryophilus]